MEIGGELKISLAGKERGKTSYLDHLFFSSGQAAIKAILTSLLEEKEIDSFLLPNYLCGSIYKPFSELDLKVEFYEVDKDLRINLIDLKKKLRRCQAIYLVDFFNVREPESTIEFLRNLKSEKVLIEDRTHTFFNEDAGIGHYKLASIRKWMGIPSGAVVKVEDEKERAKLEELTVPFTSYSLIGKRLYGFILKEKYLQEPNNEPLKEIYLNLFEEADEAVSNRTIELESIDALSKIIIETYDITDMKKKRRDNYNFLYQSLSTVFGPSNIVSGKLTPADTPLGFVIYVENRDQLKKELIKNKIYPPIHWPVPNVVKKLNMVNPLSISSKILTIPCDQRYSEKDMERIVKVIKAFYSKYGKDEELIVFDPVEDNKKSIFGGA
ncbi:hypothetical protein [Planomicrobium sp. CPCC 101110]|uniref:hypothetical protein n=1 Tax=Planomicrobium sp. CPCC 101110 TaxID=2599619 RepID=UPI0011B6AA1F|nr:hypothetical protein [Planomicrobium sp. CPCC 101110]TWT27860.1 hypothetical protein FQV30_04965 [Planomicrobium sp. CPCC 101110]